MKRKPVNLADMKRLPIAKGVSDYSASVVPINPSIDINFACGVKPSNDEPVVRKKKGRKPRLCQFDNPDLESWLYTWQDKDKVSGYKVFVPLSAKESYLKTVENSRKIRKLNGLDPERTIEYPKEWKDDEFGSFKASGYRRPTPLHLVKNAKLISNSIHTYTLDVETYGTLISNVGRTFEATPYNNPYIVAECKNEKEYKKLMGWNAVKDPSIKADQLRVTEGYIHSVGPVVGRDGEYIHATPYTPYNELDPILSPCKQLATRKGSQVFDLFSSTFKTQRIMQKRHNLNLALSGKLFRGISYKRLTHPVPQDFAPSQEQTIVAAWNDVYFRLEALQKMLVSIEDEKREEAIYFDPGFSCSKKEAVDDIEAELSELFPQVGLVSEREPPIRVIAPASNELTNWKLWMRNAERLNSSPLTYLQQLLPPTPEEERLDYCLGMKSGFNPDRSRKEGYDNDRYDFYWSTKRQKTPLERLALSLRKKWIHGTHKFYLDPSKSFKFYRVRKGFKPVKDKPQVEYPYMQVDIVPSSWDPKFAILDESDRLSTWLYRYRNVGEEVNYRLNPQTGADYRWNKYVELFYQNNNPEDRNRLSKIVWSMYFMAKQLKEQSSTLSWNAVADLFDGEVLEGEVVDNPETFHLALKSLKRVTNPETHYLGFKRSFSRIVDKMSATVDETVDTIKEAQSA